MNTKQLDDVIDHVAGLIKIGLHRAIEETEKTATAASDLYHSRVTPSAARPAQPEDAPEIWMPTLGSERVSAATGESYRVLSFSRLVSGQALMRIQFMDGQKGEYPLRNVLSDPLLTAPESSDQVS